jgi:anaerobic ribonucleoside-triphosphate reductase activating protein
VLNIAHAAPTSEANGPGRRFTVWVQGCPAACPGCFNPELRPFAPRRLVAPEELAREASADPIDGITLTGGEPFAQPADLATFLLRAMELLPERARNVIAFTGYRIEELRRRGEVEQDLLSRIDLLVDGPYDASLPCDAPYLGSANQRLIALTPRGEELLKRMEAEGGKVFGVSVGPAGEVLVSGFPPPDVLEKLRKRLEGR